MKKNILFPLAAALFLQLQSLNAYAAKLTDTQTIEENTTQICNEYTPITIIVDDAVLEFETEPEVINGIAYVPIRPVLEAYTSVDVDYKTTADGRRILSAYTYDGTFNLDVDNGNYLYYCGSSPSTVGILKNKPCIKEARTMLPVIEILTILGAKVEYDQASNTISFHTEDYTYFEEYIDLPYPIVLNALLYETDLNVIEGIASTDGYEDYIALAHKAFDEDYENEEDFDYYPSFCCKEIEEFAKLKDNENYIEYFPAFYKIYMRENFSSFMQLDDDLSTKESINNIFEFCNNYKKGSVLKINTQTEPYAKYIFSVFVNKYDFDYYYDYEEHSPFNFEENFSKYLTVYETCLWPNYPHDYGEINKTEYYLDKFYKNNREFFSAINLNYFKYNLNEAANEETDDWFKPAKIYKTFANERRGLK